MSIKRTPPEEDRLLKPRAPSEAEGSLTRRFLSDPARAYHDLLVLYAEMIKRMIRRFFRDWDDIMDVFTSVCERLQANDYAALRRFKQGSPVEPWLAVITSNASRDKARRNRVGGAPPSLLDKLEPFDRLVYRAHYLQRAEHDVIGMARAEPPSLNEVETELYRPGMVLAIEPKVRSEKSAVHLEEDVLITEKGPVFLTTGCRKLDIIK